MDKIDKKFILECDGQIPRYTSYPTAPQFSDSVDEERAASWLSSIGGNEPISLYVHIPYCQELCYYCGCHTRITQQYKPVARYLPTLLSEIELIRENIGKELNVSHLHFGGGSPTMLTAEHFREVMAAFRECFNFDDNTEIAIEMDPRGLTDDKIAVYAESGVNRGSLGIQDFNEKVQIAINRRQSLELLTEKISALRDAGIDRINFDLIYGLPEQTLDTMRRNIDITLSFSPDRIALFGYAHVPWLKKHMRLIPDNTLPSASERLEMNILAEQLLCSNGYKAIGIDHFAKDTDEMSLKHNSKTLKRNFQGYTTDEANILIGLGASSISSFRQGYTQNQPQVEQYSEAIHDSKLPTARGIVLNDIDRLHRDIIEQIMCYFEVDIAKIAAEYSVLPLEDIVAPALPRLEKFINAGYVKLTYDESLAEATLRIENHGRFIARMVSAAFDRYILPDSDNKPRKRYSQAV